jgi:hypothetical protein
MRYTEIMNINRQPTREEVSVARRNAKHTQAEAADTVHLATGQRWYEYECGRRKMDVARWELYLLLTGQHPNLMTKPRKVVKPLRARDPDELARERVAEEREAALQ